MRIYTELDEDEKKRALNASLNTLLPHCLNPESGVFNSYEGLAEKIKTALKKAEDMQTPWFAYEYILETCREELIIIATKMMEKAIYPYPHELVLYI